MSDYYEQQAKTIRTIENSVQSGFTLSETIRMLLGISFSEFSKNTGLKQEEISMCLLGYPGRELPKVRKALARKLGLKLEQMNDLISRYSREPQFD